MNVDDDRKIAAFLGRNRFPDPELQAIPIIKYRSQRLNSSKDEVTTHSIPGPALTPIMLLAPPN
jgi:hypothetical protein